MSLPFNLRSRLRAQSSPPLSRSPARAGRLRPALRPPRARLGSTSTRSAPGRDGIVTSRWPCWPMPIWPLCVSTPSGGEDLDLAADLLPLTVPEVRRLIWRLVWARPPDPVRALAWSDWRRRHQQRARRSHWTRRTRRAPRKIDLFRACELDERAACWFRSEGQEWVSLVSSTSASAIAVSMPRRTRWLS